MNQNEVKDFLNEKVEQYLKPNFIEDDPIGVPYLFTSKEDIEISAFLTATIAWGRRAMIIKNAHKMMNVMDNSPYDFILNSSPKDLNACNSFVHRTFNGVDFKTFILCLRHIYQNHGGLEKSFYTNKEDMAEGISNFKQLFFSTNHHKRSQKHVSDPLKGSAAKRLIMYLRWMVRPNTEGVDFGLWKSLSPSQLSCPLDVHIGNVGRKLGLIKRKANDWKAVKELDQHLRQYCKEDPAKYDFALFGLGLYENF